MKKWKEGFSRMGKRVWILLIMIGISVVVAAFVFPWFALWNIVIWFLAVWAAAGTAEKGDRIQDTPLPEKESQEADALVIQKAEAPFAYALLNDSLCLCQWNGLFEGIFSQKLYQGKVLSSLMKNLTPSNTKQTVSIEGQNYDGYFMQMENSFFQGERVSYALIFLNSNELRKVKEQAEEEKTVVGLIIIDNYEEVVEKVSDSAQPLLTALIDRKLNAMAQSQGGIVKKLEKDRYLLLLSKKGLTNLKTKKFEILNEVKEIHVGDHIPVTLSIGIGICDDSLDEAMKYARAAMDLALGRGGDQVLIKEGENYSFFGGKSGEVAHKSRIRSRVKADALLELMNASSSVFVMGHKNADLDSLGSAMGVYRIAKSIGRPCYIVMGEVYPGVKHLRDRLDSMPDYEGLFISPEEGLKAMDDQSLIVVVDVHRLPMMESGEMVQKAKKVVLFDHHRKSTDFIENAVLTYHEPYASSTSELITEMVQYMGEKVHLKPVEADALLAGITVDTKNFSMQTGAITFEAAAYLKRNGADSVRVRLLFQNDMEQFRAIAGAINHAEIYRDNMAISAYVANGPGALVAAAQAADELLNFVGIKASFVLCQVDSKVYVSARSLGEINVQVILEKLGGGGHKLVSGVQLENVALEEAKEMIKGAITQYMEEDS